MAMSTTGRFVHSTVNNDSQLYSSFIGILLGGPTDLDQEHGWKCFKYATRPSARRFCEELAGSKPPAGANLREWFEDQHWFLHTWQH